MTEPAVRPLSDAAAEITALQEVARAVLSVHDPAQVLLTVNNRLLELLEADIAGVWLLEDGDLVMGSCAGHRAIELARVRIRPGQSLAGHVLETGEPMAVEDYLEAAEISDHFLRLAREESVRSALAVPLRDRGGVLGVLEVWRRRVSRFSPTDVNRMEAFASLAAVALSNARLYSSQQNSLDEVAAARRSLQTQVELLQRSNALQGRLSELVLAHAGPASLAQAAAEATGAVVVLVPLGGGEGVVRPDTEDLPGLARLLRSVAARSEANSQPRRESRDDGTSCWTQRVHHDRGAPGTVVLVGDEPRSEDAAFLEMTCGQLATALRLHHLEEEAASSARDEMLEDVLWDLLLGDAPRRRAAAPRLPRLNVALGATCRVLHGSLGHASGDSDWVRTRIGAAVRQAARAFGCELTGARGEWIALIGPADTQACRDLAGAVADALGRVLDETSIEWGISGPCAPPHDLHRAHEEARTAAAVGRRVRDVEIPVYDDLGLVRFLLRESPAGDMERFVDGLLGPLLAYDRRRSGAGHLIDTLDAYFRHDCSQRETSEALGVHAKTLSYRLAQIRELTGLDLTRHTDRVRADMALRIHQIGSPEAN